MAQSRFVPPVLGYGLGLRQPHYEQAMGAQDVDWFEVVSENFMEAHPGHLEYLSDMRKKFALVLHGVGLNIGSTDSIDRDYIAKLKALAAATRPALISDHLCFTGVHGKNSHDLLPVPYTQEALVHISDRVKRVQDALGMAIALENPSTYGEFRESTMSEWEFLVRLTEQTDCGLLLDVNNVYVSAFNHRYDAKSYIDAMPAGRIAYVHLAGHRNLGTHIVDTHDDHVIPAVWELYAYTLRRLGALSTLVEWDGNLPGFDVLLAELAKAKQVAQGALRKAAS